MVTADHRASTAADAARITALVRAAWNALDGAAAVAPEGLRKGPRGGGRDRDAVVEHALGADQAYARKLGVKMRTPPRSDVAAIAALRDAITAVLCAASDGTAAADRGWPTRYAARRIAWHALDHAWEIEDRSGG